jgi:hypothetical protein
MTVDTQPGAVHRLSTGSRTLAAALAVAIAAPVAPATATPPAPDGTATVTAAELLALRQATPARHHVRTVARVVARARPPELKPPEHPRRVGGLSRTQMGHAAVIVAAGIRRDIPRRGLVVAVAVALQESRLRNLANPAVPASMRLEHDGHGYDHDSVGLFQQRPSWGSAAELMDPAAAAAKFFYALVRVDGWQDMPVTVAAQRVQRSAYPDAYAKHERLARWIVAAVIEWREQQ